jgi:hypothetical protein
MGERTMFTIKITYFKPSGKYYTDATEKREFRSLEGGSCYMNDVADWIRGLRRQDRAGTPLPGLSSSGWDGFILIDSEDGFPVLILPEGV